MSALRASFYAKNLPTWERALRVLVAVLGASLAVAFVPGSLRWLAAASALGFGVTGLVGFCPMCALAGRRLAEK